jgi:hypothetical protein
MMSGGWASELRSVSSRIDEQGRPEKISVSADGDLALECDGRKIRLPMRSWFALADVMERLKLMLRDKQG